MLNFFGTNQVVPNGYIYTSGKGTKYVCLEGVWFNNDTLKLVEPSKTERMNTAASNQILEHNKIAKTMIGESFDFTGKNYVYLGENRFIEDGVITESDIISEVIADDQRTYQVSRDTLNREWAEIGFYILPPHSEDISIPAGLEVEGYKYLPQYQRFVDVRTGKQAPPELHRKLWSDGERMVRILNSNEDSQIFPIKSVLVMKNNNVKSEWNGKEFCDNSGNVVVPANAVGRMRDAYMKFIQANPQDFPTLAKSNEPIRRDKPKTVQPAQTSVAESAGRSTLVEDEQGFSDFVKADPNKIEIPNKFTLHNDKRYNKAKNYWTEKGEPIEDRQYNKDLNTEAIKTIQEYNKTDPYPVNSTINYKGETLTWTGLNWVSSTKVYNDKFSTKVDEWIDENGSTSSSSSETSSTESSELPIGTKVSYRGSDYFYKGGTTFENSLGDKLPEELAKNELERQAEYKRQKDAGVEHASGSAEPTHLGSGVGVPSGYQIKSGSGKTYVKKGEQWIDQASKKPLNSSASKSVEAAAQKAVQNHNDANPSMKIGQEVKAKSGTKYTYVGGDRFVSEDGKLLPKGAAQTVINKAQTKHDDADARKDDKEEEQRSDAQPEQQPEPQGAPAEPASDPSSAGPMADLAQRIKSSPFAKKIRVLLTRGDAVSLLAADIMLSGNRDEAVKILKSLNNNDE